MPASTNRSSPHKPRAAPAAPDTTGPPPDEQQQAHKARHRHPPTEPTQPRPQPDKQPLAIDKPGAGRTTKLGRKTESPASIKTAGPSGQKSKAQHHKRHTNK